ncbi:hypothetical protein BFJ68_g16400 [Fusarium oxysporum]|uniref:Uncharacterized protein n=1 Tax=Fusarium oxysporum TaxID=5507 RepID=A0A420NRH3_FUSOX|nr:hypothetical protein BFJ71_g15129 [Fusarium oxysporum]RKK90633.1 hypothetical protein BFJ68_g16400 [Fusarium oxysporum]
MDLSDEQKAAFDSNKRQSCQSPPNIHDVMRLTAEIDRRVAGNVGGGRCFGTRLVNVLEAVQRFAALGDIVVGGSQNMIACGVWSLVRMTLLMLVNVSSWFDKLSELFMTVGRSAPRYQAMALLYPRSKKLQSHLSEYFLVVVRICHDLLKLTQKSMFAQLVSFTTESDMSSYQSDFDLWANAIKEEVNLLMAEQLQEQSRRLGLLHQYSESESHRKKLENRLRILDSCSTYDYQTTWKEIRRCGNTSWFTLQREYQDWKVRSESCTLLYTGKLGSGKSISLANMVDDLNLRRQGSPPVAYFFCRHDAPESRRARTILGALARQLLCTIEEPTAMSEDLVVTGPPVLDSDGILRLLNRTLNPTCRAYFILDGLDECDESQKEDVILRLRKIQTICPLLICLSFREEAGKAPALYPEIMARPSKISIPENNPDIAEFIQTELERRVELGRLRVGEPTLVLEIRDALLERAQGMFLWVVLQINSLCQAKTDESIRRVLADLPRDLPETFSRILKQSAALGKEDQRRALELITVACRPLTTDELREALGVVPGDPDWNPARMPNDIYAALACCGSLVIVDEETLSVKLIHHSVKQFLLSGQESVAGQTFTIQDANKTMAGVVVTYLNYGIFDTQLSNTVVPQVRHGAVPMKVISSVLDSQSVQKLALRLLKSQEPLNIDISKDGAIDSKNRFGRTTLSWAAERGHEAVVRQLLEKDAAIDSKNRFGRTPLWLATEGGHEAVVRLLLEKGAAIDSEDGDGRTPLWLAAGRGHEAVVRLLLEKGATSELKGGNGQTTLSWAAERGHEAVVRLLALARGG